MDFPDFFALKSRKRGQKQVHLVPSKPKTSKFRKRVKNSSRDERISNLGDTCVAKATDFRRPTSSLLNTSAVELADYAAAPSCFAGLALTSLFTSQD